jgi:hypothetical protein
LTETKGFSRTPKADDTGLMEKLNSCGTLSLTSTGQSVRKHGKLNDRFLVRKKTDLKPGMVGLTVILTI